MRASRGLLVLLLACAALIACAGGGGSPGGVSGVLPFRRDPAGASPIKHVIIVIQENRTFDNLFATFPGANGTTTGNLEAVPPALQYQCPYPYATSTPLAEKPLATGNDYEHRYEAPNPSLPGGYLVDLDGGFMDGFDLSYVPAGNKIDCTGPYEYVKKSDIQEYWDLATQYVLADNIFQTQGSGSFTGHQDLIAGGTVVPYGSGTASVIDNPTNYPWGCDAPSGTQTMTSLITTDLQYLLDLGPFPCFSYLTMRDLLDAKSVSWKYYAQRVQGPKGPQRGDTAGIWSGFDAISAVRYSPEWGKNVTFSDLKIFKDINAGKLPAVSWITPNAQNSDHPQEHEHGKLVDFGPSWVAQIVNAVGKSKYWKSSAIIVVWDDWGGFYDHVPPPKLSPPDNQGGLGFRVPMLIVSPYVKPHVEHTQYEFGSILHFIEDNWNLGNLGQTDVRATSIGNAFDYNIPPRTFKQIRTKHSLQFFLNQKPSHELPDTE